MKVIFELADVAKRRKLITGPCCPGTLIADAADGPGSKECAIYESCKECWEAELKKVEVEG